MNPSIFKAYDIRGVYPDDMDEATAYVDTQTEAIIQRALRQLLKGRTSFVIAPDGRILFVYSALDPVGHVAKTLAAVRAWHAAHGG